MMTFEKIEEEVDKTMLDIIDAQKRRDEATNQLVFEVYRLQVAQLNAKLDTLRMVQNG